jgi:hypothetical protein
LASRRGQPVLEVLAHQPLGLRRVARLQRLHHRAVLQQ